MSYRVWRYENSNGTGPYVGGWDKPRLQEMSQAHSSFDFDNPTYRPTAERIRPHNDEHAEALRCALMSLSDVARWFSSWHLVLYEEGFMLVEYEVRRLETRADTWGQVVFDVRNTRKVRKLSRQEAIIKMHEYSNR